MADAVTDSVTEWVGDGDQGWGGSCELARSLRGAPPQRGRLGVKNAGCLGWHPVALQIDIQNSYFDILCLSA